MTAIVKRILVNREYCINFAIKWTGAFFTLWGIIALFFPCDNLIDSSLDWWIRLLIAILIVFSIFMVVFVIGVVIILNTNKIKLMDVGNNHHIYVQYGDVFSPNVLDTSVISKKRNVLVSVNRCFDTIVDDKLISSKSLHGEAMNNLYTSGKYTADTLDAEIQKKLKSHPFTTVSKNNKPQGNLKRYIEGTTVEIEASLDVVYFFLGLTSFDRQLHPYISDEEYGIALVRGLEYCIKHNQGYPVIIPLIGGGRAQTRKEEKDILEFIVKLIQMNRLSVNCDIHIVVRNSAKETISISKLKA